MPEDDPTPSIRVLLDENVPVETSQWLRVRKPYWTVLHAYDVGLGRRPDVEVFDWAQDNGYLVITFDVTFANGREFPAGEHNGIIRLRVGATTLEATENALERLFYRFSDEELLRSVVIVGKTTIRRLQGD